jgi:MFS transporter, ACS family, hexuronate transporter
VISLMTCIGSIAGGWISSTLIGRGWSVNAARKTAFLICALCVVPVFATPLASKWIAVFLVGLASAAHMGFAANLFTMVSDTTPREAISSVVGIGGMAAGIGGMLSAKIIGAVLSLTGSYQSLFIAASMIYLVALLVMHLLNPRLEPMKLAVGDSLHSRSNA